MNKQQCIVILDFGSQYTQLIARRVRECGVYSEVFASTLSATVLRALQPTGIILSGGPDSVNATADVPRIPDAVFEQGCPVLGICYGMQAMAKQLGGAVSASATREFGHTDLQFDTTSPLFKQIDGHSIVWMSHGDKVTECPAGFTAIAHSEHSPIAAMADPARGYYAVQFHPEVTHTEPGEAILKNFLYDICGCEYVWSPEHIVEEQLTNIREAVKDERVILGLSGGVDSAVLAVLLHRAIGDQLTCLFIDNGLLRQGEAEQVMHVFGQQMGLPVVLVDARADFLSVLSGISDPETKRKRIGKLFIDVFVREAKKLRDANWLAQGTIYPDVIESAANQHGTSDLIKSHHNVGGLPEQIGLKLLEPLRDLFKDEVRKIGHVLGLPDSMVYRHPFPGPGLAVRIAGEITEERLQIVRSADAIFMEMLRDSDFYGKVSQAFAVLLPVKSVGVVGDQRSYAEVIALRAVCTTDFMTATSAELPHTLLTRIASRIVNEVPGVSRVLYDITSKPPATIEWE